MPSAGISSTIDDRPMSTSAPAAVASEEKELEDAPPDVRLLVKRRQMFEVQEALEAQKERYAAQEKDLHAKEEALKKRDIALQDSLLRFSKFLQENDVKKARALKKILDEKRLRGEKERDICEQVSALEGLKAAQQTMRQRIANSAKYQHYLESVLEASEGYHEVADLIVRQTTLDSTQADLEARLAASAAAAEAVRGELQRFRKAQADELVYLNNSVAVLKEQLERVREEGRATEAGSRMRAAVVAKYKLEHGQVCMSTENLYSRCLEHSRVAHTEQMDPLVQLDVIGFYIGDLHAAIQKAL